MNDHCRNIQSRLNDRGRYQNIDSPINKVVHDSLQLGFLHLPMGKCHVRLRNKFLNLRSHVSYSIHSVIHIINLPVTGKFSDNRLPHQLIIVLHNVGLNW